MRLFRLSLSAFLAAILLVACTQNEPALEKAAADLRTQLQQRERLLAEVPLLNEYRGKLRHWLEKPYGSGEMPPAVPVPPVSLEPFLVAPVLIPELPRPQSMESGKAESLRAEISDLLERIRKADKELTALEKLRDECKLRYEKARAAEIEYAKVQNRPGPLDVVSRMNADMAARDAGTMRRVSP